MTGLRVLIVEDEPIVAMTLEDILMDLGHDVVGPAGRLDEGLELAEEPVLDLAVLDVNLGGERSTPIARRLRERGIRFVFATGYGAAPEGFEDVPLVSKPYRQRDISAALAAAQG